jgi:2-polyprenyl-6-methoxyphenol hydroxylase-like FAD-dependent oxidoreductase
MKAVICGAGIAGLTLAWFLERDGWDVLIVERSPGPRGAGYVIDFFASGYDAAELMGLLPRLRELDYGIPAVTYVDDDGRERSRIDYGTFRRLQNDRLLTLMRGDLERALLHALGERVAFRFPRSIDAVARPTTRSP